ncbi:MAG: hypothetical protein EBY21_09565 [Alphaproteobacteria bacterium]|nr:hypothetical protein [Alphaproteobacteria bacterium]
MMSLHRFSRHKTRAFSSQDGLNRAAEAAGRACCAPIDLEPAQEQSQRPWGAFVLFMIALSLSCSLSLIGWFLA